MSPLLNAIKPLLKGVIFNEDAIINVITHWPNRDPEEAQGWMHALLLSDPDLYARVGVPTLQALEAAFGTGIWNLGQGKEHPLALIFSSKKSAYGTDSFKVAKDQFLMERIPDEAWRMPELFETQYRWLTQHLHKDSTQAIQDLITQTIERVQWDVNRHPTGNALGQLIKQPEHFKAWLKNGGDLTVCGWDPQSPDRTAGAFLMEHAPQLTPLLHAQGYEPPALSQANPEAQKAYWLNWKQEQSSTRGRNKSTAAERWEYLKTNLDCLMYRDPATGTLAFWLEVQHTPALLPIFLQQVKRQPELRAVLEARHANGSGLWSLLIKMAPNPSITPKVCDDLSDYLDPAQESALLAQVLFHQKENWYNLHEIPVLRHFRSDQWFGDDHAQTRLLAQLRREEVSLNSFKKLVHELKLEDRLIPDVCLYLLMVRLQTNVRSWVKKSKDPWNDDQHREMTALLAQNLDCSPEWRQRWQRHVAWQENQLKPSGNTFGSVSVSRAFERYAESITDKLQAIERERHLAHMSATPPKPTSSRRTRMRG